MLETLTAALFAMVAGVSVWMGLRLTDWRARGLERLAPSRPKETQGAPSMALIWQELVKRIGTTLPASERDLPVLRKRLIRAGYRGANAARYFQGIRWVAAIGFLLLALGWALHTHSDNVVMIPLAMGAIGWITPMQVLTLKARRRQNAIAKGLPNALDLMVVCVEAGLGMDQTMLQVAKELEHAHPEICGEFAVMNLELRAGIRRAEALHNLAERTGVDDVRKLVAVLIQTDRFGTSIAASLRGHADYLRAMARQRAEERASKLAVKLVFPIFFCVLPSLFVVTIGPVMTRLVRDLIPMIQNL
jgi:tight adherence protein C